jgi:quercetin dioxygenase-like cupin family protein
MKHISTIVLSVCFCIIAHAQQYNKGVVVETILKSDTTSIGQKINYPQFANSEVTIAKVTIEPGESTGWHKHTFPVFAYILQGVLTVEFENLKPKQFTAGTSFPEVINTLHNGTNNGFENVVLIAFYLGEKGKGLSSK